MKYVINWALLKEPLNWLTVWTMALLLWFLFEALSRHPAAAISLDDNA